MKIAELDKTSKSNELLNLLSETAEKVGDFTKAIEFEKAKTEGINEEIAVVSSPRKARLNSGVLLLCVGVLEILIKDV